MKKVDLEAAETLAENYDDQAYPAPDMAQTIRDLVAEVRRLDYLDIMQSCDAAHLVEERDEACRQLGEVDCLRHTAMVKLAVAREALEKIDKGYSSQVSKQVLRFAREALAKIGGSDA